jgi:histidyl-tRNA synthetase
VQRPRGTKDLFGEELAAVRHVLKILNELCDRYGYQEVETPIFEHLELFTAKSGESVVKQLYAFKDKGGRDLALRPELTAPVVRLYVERLKSAPKPLKLYYSGSCFRYEEPQAWRWRQFLQAGAEIIGSKTPESDAELIVLANDLMREVGLRSWAIRLGNVQLLREILVRGGVRVEAQDPILRAIDSHDEERVVRELQRAGLRDEQVKQLQRISSLRGGLEVLREIEKLTNLESAPILENLREITVLLDVVGVKYEIDFGIARGLDYYTGFVFEVYASGVQVAGGGRYDDLIKLFGGAPTPATGVGFGLDRISRILLEQRVKIPVQNPQLMIIPTAQKFIQHCFKIAAEVRKAGISAELELAGRKLTKALEHANSIGVELVALAGPREFGSGLVLLRDMKSGEQETVRVEELAKKLKSMS